MKTDKDRSLPTTFVRIGFFNFSFIVFLLFKGENLENVDGILDEVFTLTSTPRELEPVIRDLYSEDTLVEVQHEELFSKDITKEKITRCGLELSN